MSAIRLLSAPVDPTPISQVESQSTSLVPIRRLPLAPRTIPASDTAYPAGNYIWTASAGSDGSFTFYALPRKPSANGQASSPWDGGLFNSGWNTQALRYAAAQYALNAGQLPRF